MFLSVSVMGHVTCLDQSCPIYPIRNGSQKGYRFATDRDDSPGSYDPSQIVTECLDRHTGSHVAREDSGSELQVVCIYP